MEHIGLVLQGGGLRGVYTAGVLDFFMEKEMYFPYVIGVSAGAMNGLSYVSRQKGRNRDITMEFINDPRYVNAKNFFLGKEVFGLDFIFEDICKDLNPFDFEGFMQSKQKFTAVCTDIETGTPVYYEKNTSSDILLACKASSSLPLINSLVEYEDKKLMDGGLSDPIPFKRAMADGYKHNVLVLTRDKDFEVSDVKHKLLLNRNYGQYPHFLETIYNSPESYESTLKEIDQKEADGDFFVIRPSEPIKIKSFEQNIKELMYLYVRGYVDAEKSYGAYREWEKKIEAQYMSDIAEEKAKTNWFNQLFKKKSK